ncbi:MULTISPECIES: tRNA (adenosine(37)-N6)-threonylcarbamoyltransferase complex ATPase subunit type 1 TsaE [unclassified Microcoleus]|uniref:tRNA (adenosine(37)-N6)-threonylcarbamoyltransferase complex ATPase subunit type 1 TsaE n=1 Tax=unclassified Microcoleus TaxID=2642155 RepID=UPI002FD21501
MILSLPDAEATRKLGVSLGRSIPAGTVILLQGDLGAGKTTLVQGIAEGLGIQESIESPTFTLINEYFAGRIPLYHLDLYRLEPEEAEALHLESYWDGLERDLGIVAIEWAQRLPYKPENSLQISLSYLDNGRQIEVIGNGELLDWQWEN